MSRLYGRLRLVCRERALGRASTGAHFNINAARSRAVAQCGRRRVRPHSRRGRGLWRPGWRPVGHRVDEHNSVQSSLVALGQAHLANVVLQIVHLVARGATNRCSGLPVAQFARRPDTSQLLATAHREEGLLVAVAQSARPARSITQLVVRLGAWNFCRGCRSRQQYSLLASSHVWYCWRCGCRCRAAGPT